MSDEPLTFADVHLVVARRLAAFEWNAQMVDEVTDAVCFAIAQEYGGRNHYVPKRGGALKARIRREFNGRNVQELSYKYGISNSTVYRLLAK